MKDLNEAYPYRMEEIKRWFKHHKTFEGKKSNWIYYDEKILDLDRTFEVIHESHIYWKDLKEAGKEFNKDFDDYKKKLFEKSKEYCMNN